MTMYRIIQVWKGTNKKLSRCGKDWVAMSRGDWARSAGLSESEIKNYALPKLKDQTNVASKFLTFEAWKLRGGQPQKPLWIHVNEEAMYDEFGALDGDALMAEDYQTPAKAVGGSPWPEGYFKTGKTSCFDHLKTVNPS
jgi:hypothetical protein